MLLAICGTLLHHGIVDYKLIFIALVLGTIIGVPLGEVAMTAVPQRTALSHAFGALCVTLVGTAEFYLRTHVHRQLDGCGKTAGTAAATADYVQRAKLRQPRIAGCGHHCGRYAGSSSGKDAALSADCRHPAFVRRDDDRPHRRRGRCAARRPRKRPRFLPRQIKSSLFPATEWQWPRPSTKCANFMMR